MPSPRSLSCRLFGITLAVTLGCALPAGAAWSQADPLAKARQQFVAARAAIRPGVQSPEQPGDDALKDYPLYPYLQAARIQRSLAAAQGASHPADAHAEMFLETWGAEPVGSGVRRALLASLAGRRQWESYLRHVDESTTDRATRCQTFVARIEAGRTQDLEPAVAALWLTGEQLPSECEPAFAWMRSRNALSHDLVEQRVRLLLGNGHARFARIIARPLPAERASPLSQWAALIEQPRAEIDRLIGSPSVPVEPAALRAGWERLVRSSYEDALARFDRLVAARKLDRAAASPLALALALRLSWNRHPETLSYFALAESADFDDASREWQARAALWNGEWATVREAIAGMSRSQQESARWRYWDGRAAERQGDLVTARRLYAATLGSDNYYSGMSAARLGHPYTPNAVPVVSDESELKRVAAEAPFVRARELMLAGMRGEAYSEWQHGFRSLPETRQPEAVHLGMRWGWYDIAIATATQQRIFEDYALLYPRPYDREVETAARQAGLEPELVYGVMRQESLFRADAVSSAGAVGLLQLLPETARLTARRANLASPDRRDLLNPAVNVRLGATHLRELIDRWEGQLPLALASYNAGPGAARRWLPDRPIDKDIWVENIPFNETRNYVQRIFWHRLVFSWLRTGEPQDTRHWLTEIRGAGATLGDL